MLSIKLLILGSIFAQAIYPVAQRPGGQRAMYPKFWMLSIGFPPLSFPDKPLTEGGVLNIYVVVAAQYISAPS